MNELERRVAELRGSLGEPRWSERREAQLRTQVALKLAARKALRLPALAASVALAAGLVLWFGLRPPATPLSSPVADRAAAFGSALPTSPPSIVFQDGSRAEALSANMKLAALGQDAHQIEARLDDGAARFEVVRNPNRQFVVRAGSVTVTVLGTVFTVAHEGPRVRVAVLVGSVRVDWAGGSSTLAQDSEGSFPPFADPVALEPGVAPPSASGEAHTSSTTRPAHGRWVELARGGDFRAAYADLSKLGNQGVRDVPEELLLAADVSRRAGHAAQAARHLERMLARYPKDSRAEVAAFTLGRIRLQLGQPAAAAAAFEQVVASRGPLAEDGLYRAMIAHQQAGASAKAAALRSRYLTTYPGGRYAEALQKP